MTVRRPTTADVRLRTLEFLAAHPSGCTEAALAAESIPADVLIELVRDQGGAIEVTRVWITESGELARIAEF